MMTAQVLAPFSDHVHLALHPALCHRHGSTTLQVPTASLLVIIEGGPEWLPDAK